MIIGVDAGCLGVTDKRLKTGVYYFAYYLLKNLLKIDKRNQYLLYSFHPLDTGVLRQFGSGAKNLVLRPSKGWLNFRLSLEFWLNKPDIFLGLNQALPLFHPVKSIIYIHDLAFEHYPACYPDSYPRLSRQTRYAVRHCDKIVAVSQSTKNDLVRLYNVDSEKIKVICHGVSADFKPQGQEKINIIREKYRLSQPYFLFVGSFKPLKNIPGIIQAFALFCKRSKSSYKLVLIGSDFWRDKEISKTIEDLDLESEVVNLGYLETDDLPAIYSGATAFISPSLYEGFGMPHLEAMSCGTPVITSDGSSMSEMIEKAGLLVDPFNIYEISQAMQRLVTDKELYSKLKEKSLKRAKEFSWKKSAESLLDMIKNLIDSRSGRE